MSEVNMLELSKYAKQFSGLTAEYEAELVELSSKIAPYISMITDSFYRKLEGMKETNSFLEGRLESLKETHNYWLASLFEGSYGEQYTAKMYKVGDVHVKVKLPVEFMAGAMTIVGNDFIPVITKIYGSDLEQCVKAQKAVNAVLGYSLMVMQESYQASSLVAELEKFLAISGMSRTLFNNLARAYQA